ncbi:integrator complex subunit 3 [Cavenderia fasciculata]|uniref:Integrator complex subunit 3 n=1 Tax=Cavenderia fasciculata TaxID=261658 RepID=F4Q684_CACFS|nr:integrator complex subunit 3 [Cavenderia fasciculata]EGG17458.1 integrator complex subunit 3 [Cavenderia fasciculata]|eukprot:XP_004355942.1 integrator complex subunit 3 [Cavenderia fasciculata]
MMQQGSSTSSQPPLSSSQQQQATLPSSSSSSSQQPPLQPSTSTSTTTSSQHQNLIARNKFIIKRELDESDQIEILWRDQYEKIEQVLNNGTDNDIHIFLMERVSESNERHVDVTIAILYGILVGTSNYAALFKYITLVTKDSLTIFCAHLKRLVIEKYHKMADLPRTQVLWILNELIVSNHHDAEAICALLMRQMFGGNITTRNIQLINSVLTLLNNNKQWLISKPSLIPTVLYTFLRLIQDHFKPQFQQLRDLETAFCIDLIRTKFQECLTIGRDLFRLLHYLSNKAQEFDLLWRDINTKPLLFNVSTFTDISVGVRIPTPKHFLQSRLSPEMEGQILYILKEVKFGNQKRYQQWFVTKHLPTIESETLIPDLIRYICCFYHPPNHVLCSDICPRWAIIGWLLKHSKDERCRNYAKLALFYDWLYYDQRIDSIMNIEPAMLLMACSIKKYSDMTVDLVEFIINVLLEGYDPSRRDQIRGGVNSAFSTVLEKGVVPTLSHMFAVDCLGPQLFEKSKQYFTHFMLGQPGVQPAPGQTQSPNLSSSGQNIGGPAPMSYSSQSLVSPPSPPNVPLANNNNKEKTPLQQSTGSTLPLQQPSPLHLKQPPTSYPPPHRLDNSLGEINNNNNNVTSNPSTLTSATPTTSSSPSGTSPSSNVNINNKREREDTSITAKPPPPIRQKEDHPVNNNNVSPIAAPASPVASPLTPTIVSPPNLIQSSSTITNAPLTPTMAPKTPLASSTTSSSNKLPTAPSTSTPSTPTSSSPLLTEPHLNFEKQPPAPAVAAAATAPPPPSSSSSPSIPIVQETNNIEEQNEIDQDVLMDDNDEIETMTIDEECRVEVPTILLTLGSKSELQPVNLASTLKLIMNNFIGQYSKMSESSQKEISNTLVQYLHTSLKPLFEDGAPTPLSIFSTFQVYHHLFKSCFPAFTVTNESVLYILKEYVKLEPLLGSYLLVWLIITSSGGVHLTPQGNSYIFSNNSNHGDYYEDSQSNATTTTTNGGTKDKIEQHLLDQLYNNNNQVEIEERLKLDSLFESIVDNNSTSKQIFLPYLKLINTLNQQNNNNSNQNLTQQQIMQQLNQPSNNNNNYLEYLIMDLKRLQSLGILFYVLPMVYRYLPMITVGNVDMITLVIDYIGPQQLYRMCNKMSMGEFRMFGSGNPNAIIEYSLGMESFEQQYIWRLLASEESYHHMIVTRIFPSIMTRIDPINNSEVLLSLVQILKDTTASNKLFMEIIGLAPSYHMLSFTVFSSWIQKQSTSFASIIYDIIIANINEKKFIIERIFSIMNVYFKKYGDQSNNNIRASNNKGGKSDNESVDNVLSLDLNDRISRIMKTNNQYQQKYSALYAYIQLQQQQQTSTTTTPPHSSSSSSQVSLNASSKNLSSPVLQSNNNQQQQQQQSQELGDAPKKRIKK